METTKSKENLNNETKRSLQRFETNRIFSLEWPSGENDRAIQVLEHQLRFAGGFGAQMELIDLDTPKNVRLNVERVLNLLRIKPPVTESVDSFVIPNVGILESSDQIKNVVEKFCNALGLDPVMMNTVELFCNTLGLSGTPDSLSATVNLQTNEILKKYCCVLGLGSPGNPDMAVNTEEMIKSFCDAVKLGTLDNNPAAEKARKTVIERFCKVFGLGIPGNPVTINATEIVQIFCNVLEVGSFGTHDDQITAVKEATEKIYHALGIGTPDNPFTTKIEIKALTLPCDEVSDKFHCNNLDWIDDFCSGHQIKRISIKVNYS